MSDNMLNVLDTLVIVIGELKLRGEQLIAEQNEVLLLQRNLANQYALHEQLLGERNALRNKLALIEVNEKCSFD